MALPVLDAAFASSADLPRRQLLSKWLVNTSYSGTVDDFYNLPERYLYAKIAVELGGPRTEQEYIELPKSYAWSDIYGAIIFNRTAPAAPSNLTLTPLTSSSMRLNWVTNGASVAYSVERSVDGAAFQVIGTTAIGATTATNTGLSIASNYQYRIRGSSGGFFTGYSNTASASTYDDDAIAFAASSGAVDIAALSAFAQGVKNLGLWNSMVCWPLRSSQNAGTGTTVYSFGGLGTFNGVLTNGPTWAADGIIFNNAETQKISTTAFPINSQNWAIGYVTNTTSIYGNGDAMGWDQGGEYTVLSWGGSRLLIIQSDGGTSGVPTGETTGSWQTIIGARTKGGDASTGRRAYRNGALNASLSSSNQTMLFVPSIMSVAAALTGTRAFGFAVNADMTGTQIAAFNTLYKTTLGTGLGLP